MIYMVLHVERGGGGRGWGFEGAVEAVAAGLMYTEGICVDEQRVKEPVNAEKCKNTRPRSSVHELGCQACMRDLNSGGLRRDYFGMTRLGLRTLEYV